MAWKKDKDGWHYAKKDDPDAQDLAIGGLRVNYFNEEQDKTRFYDRYGYPLTGPGGEIDWDQFEKEHPDGHKGK